MMTFTCLSTLFYGLLRPSSEPCHDLNIKINVATVLVIATRSFRAGKRHRIACLNNCTKFYYSTVKRRIKSTWLLMYTTLAKDWSTALLIDTSTEQRLNLTADNKRVTLSQSYLLKESAALVCLFEASSRPSLGCMQACVYCVGFLSALVIYPCLSILLQVLSP